jgi:hypothetical protein
MVLRVLGWLFLLAGVAAFGRDLLRSFDAGGAFRLSALGELWYALDPGSLNLAQAVVQRYLWAPLWDPGLITLLLWPAAFVLGGLGLVLLVLGRLGRARRRSRY